MQEMREKEGGLRRALRFRPRFRHQCMARRALRLGHWRELREESRRPTFNFC